MVACTSSANNVCLSFTLSLLPSIPLTHSLTHSLTHTLSHTHSPSVDQVVAAASAAMVACTASADNRDIAKFTSDIISCVPTLNPKP